MSRQPRTPTPRSRFVTFAVSAALPVTLLTGLVGAPPANGAAAPVRPGLYGSTDPTYDGVFRQSLAILGLHAAGRTPRPEAVAWLLRQQCPTGGFPSYRESAVGSCPAYDPDTYVGGEDTNATALAAQALIAVGQDAAAARALARLVALQQPDGGWEFTVGAGYGSDPNSTGLVLGALSAGERVVPADAIAFIAGLQVGRTDFATAPADERGAIAASFAPGANVLATVQSVPFLSGADLVEAVGGPWTDSALPAPSSAADIPPATAAGVSHWAATYLDSATPSGSEASWAILSLAADRTGEIRAHQIYTQVVAGHVGGDDAAANGLAAVAARALGRAADTATYADRIAATLQRDTAAPTARWAATRPTLFTGQEATLRRITLSDDVWPTSRITQTVSWGDGTIVAVMPTTTALSHRYASGGSRRVVLTVRDPSGNTRVTTVATIAVRVDRTAPRTSIVTPRRSGAAASWRTIRISASDASGVRRVLVRLSVTRGTTRYVCTGTRWVRSGSRLPYLVATRGAVWTLRIPAPPQGLLRIGAVAIDNADNAAPVVIRSVRVR